MTTANPQTDLASRLQQEIEKAKGQVAQFHKESSQKSQTLNAGYAKFEEVRARLAEQFKLRIKALTESIKESKVDHERDRDGGEVRISMGHTELVPPSVVLRFVLSHGGAVESLAIDYYLSIIPVLFEFKAHDRIEMPLDQIDDAKLMAWVDDRIVEFTRTYLQIPFIDAYTKDSRVVDPVAKVSFNRVLAKGSVEYKGTKYYFASDESLKAFQGEPGKFAGV